MIQEKVRTVTASRSEIKFTVSDYTLEKLKQLKDLIGDQSLEKIFDQALDALLLSEKKQRGVIPKQAIVSDRKINPARKSAPQPTIATHAAHGRPAYKEIAETENGSTTESNIESKTSPLFKPALKFALNSRFIPIDLKRFVFARSKGQCEYIDPRTKARCQSRFRLQIDHHIPLDLGGQTNAYNLRHLCFSHNLRMAAQAGLHRPKSEIKYG